MVATGCEPVDIDSRDRATIQDRVGGVGVAEHDAAEVSRVGAELVDERTHRWLQSPGDATGRVLLGWGDGALIRESLTDPTPKLGTAVLGDGLTIA